MLKNIPDTKTLKKICWRSKPDFYRKISIPLLRLCLKLGFKANHITALRALFLIGGFALFFFGPYAAIAGVLCYQFVLLLDTLDGAIARYNKESSFLGEAMDLALDHLSSTILYFLSLGILAVQLTETLDILFISIATILIAQFAAFARTLYVEYHIPTERYKKKSFWLRLFHQDNMRFLLLLLTIAAPLSLLYPQLVSGLAYTYLAFAIAKSTYLFLLLWRLSKTFPLTPHVISAYFLGVAYIKLYIFSKFLNKKPKRFTAYLRKNFSDTVIIPALLKLST